MTDSPTHYIPRRPNYGSHSVSRKPAKSKKSLLLEPLNSSKETNLWSRKNIFQYNNIMLPSKGFITESPSPDLHNHSLKDIDFSRSNSPVKLEKIPSSVDVSRGMEGRFKGLSSIRNRSNNVIGIQGYLDYLNSGSISDLANFKKKIEPRNKVKPIEYDPHFAQHWLHEFIPHEVKKLPYQKSEHQRTSSDLEPSPSHSLQTDQTILFPRKFNSEFSFESKISKRKSLNKRSLQHLPRLEPDPNAIPPQKLAEEIAVFYKTYQDHNLTNKTMHEEMAELLKKQGVYDVFVGKGEKHIPLHTRIYHYMTERAFERQILKKSKVNTEESETRSREHSVEKHEKREIILSRYHAFKKVHERLQDLNLEVKIQKLQGLEMKLLQNHEDMISQKDLVLKSLKSGGKKDLRRQLDIKRQCEATMRFIPRYEELKDGRKGDHDEFFQEELPINVKEIKTVNRTLNKMLRNWQTSLYNASPNNL